MRWIVVLALGLSAGACDCGAVDDAGKKAARVVTGAEQVEQGQAAKKKVQKALKEAEELRQRRAEKVLEAAEK